jgi:hypothetical protein
VKDRVATRVDSAQGQARMPQQGRILRDETRASQSTANKGTSQNWNNKGGRLLAWIGDQVRLKAFSGQPRALYT